MIISQVTQYLMDGDTDIFSSLCLEGNFGEL